MVCPNRTMDEQDELYTRVCVCVRVLFTYMRLWVPPCAFSPWRHIKGTGSREGTLQRRPRDEPHLFVPGGEGKGQGSTMTSEEGERSSYSRSVHPF